jgi:hypothetical protein
LELTDEFSTDYTSNQKGVARGPGYVLKYETKSRCKSATLTKSSIKLGKRAEIVIPPTEYFADAEICKLKSGTTERYIYTSIEV